MNPERDSGSVMSARCSYRKRRCLGQMFVSLPLKHLHCSGDVLELGDDGSQCRQLIGSIADSATEASPSRSDTELSEPSSEPVRDRKRFRRETSRPNNFLPYIKPNTAKLKVNRKRTPKVNDLIRLENSNTPASSQSVRSMDKFSAAGNRAPSPAVTFIVEREDASTADVTSSRDVTSLAERRTVAVIRNVAVDRKRAKGNAIIPEAPVSTTDVQTPDSTTLQSYQELTTDLGQLDPHSKELCRCSVVDSVSLKNSFRSSTSAGHERHSLLWREGEEEEEEAYWLTTILPPTDQLFVEPHWTNIGHVVSVYDDFRRNITTILRGEERTLPAIHSECLRYVKRKPMTSSFPPSPPPLPHGTSAAAAAEVCDAYRRFYHRLCVNSQGFPGIDRRDQLVILDHGQSASVALVAASHLHPSEGDVYRRHLKNDLEIRGPALDAHCRRLSELSHRLRALDVDFIEESLLNSLLLIAADYPNLSRPDYIEKIRYSLLKTFQAYITAKFGSSSSRLRHLLYFGPKIREMGNELRKLLKQAVSSSRNKRDKKITNLSSSKRFCITLEENMNNTVPDSTTSEASTTQRRYLSEEFPSFDRPGRLEKELHLSRTFLLLQHDSKGGNFAEQCSEDFQENVLDMNDRTVRRKRLVENEAYCSNREILPQNDSRKMTDKERQLSFREDRTETWKNQAHVITVF